MKIYKTQKNTQYPKGYSIIISIMTIGFLLVLTTSTFNLVLQELQDGKGRENYMKAFAGAEGALELALLKIKENGYGYQETLVESKDLKYFGDTNKNATVEYDIQSETNSYNGTIEQYETEIIPLFTITDTTGSRSGITDINFQDLDNAGINWNIVSEASGVSGVGSFNEGSTVGLRTLVGQSFQFQENTPVSQILSGYNGNYLMLLNPSGNKVDYLLGSSTEFTKPRAVIYSTAKLGKYSQNLKTTVDNSEFLGILRYSIYSGN